MKNIKMLIAMMAMLVLGACADVPVNDGPQSGEGLHEIAENMLIVQQSPATQTGASVGAQIKLVGTPYTQTVVPYIKYSTFTGFPPVYQGADWYAPTGNHVLSITGLPANANATCINNIQVKFCALVRDFTTKATIYAPTCTTVNGATASYSLAGSATPFYGTTDVNVMWEVAYTVTVTYVPYSSPIPGQSCLAGSAVNGSPQAHASTVVNSTDFRWF